jgi:hypothetical protein
VTVLDVSLKGAALIDFTGTVPGCLHLAGCSSEFMALMRASHRPEVVILIDRAIGPEITSAAVVSDHINLSGNNPLLGPNHPSGKRFPVVQGIYVTDHLPAVQRVVVAGIKPGVRLTPEEMKLVKQYGAQACCYNIVPAMLVAAHSSSRVLAILLPENGPLPEDVQKELHTLAGVKA